MLRPLHCFVALCLALVVAGAASAQPGAHAARPGKLKLDKQIGNALPTKGGISIVDVDCPGRPDGGVCAGTIRLLPRGAKTKALVGSAPIATASARLPSGTTRQIRMKLNARARAAIRGEENSLVTTVELRSRGTVTRRLEVVVDFKGVRGHARPDRVTRGQFKAGGATVNYQTYTWKWDIPVRKFLELPDFRCPSYAPQLTTNGNKVIYWNYNERRDLGFQAYMDARARSGTGYSNFTQNHLKQSYDGYRTFWYMVGWPSGDWFHNSVWAPLAFDDGHFELTVTCTDKTDVLGSTAIIYESDRAYLMFPWGG